MSSQCFAKRLNEMLLGRRQCSSSEAETWTSKTSRGMPQGIVSLTLLLESLWLHTRKHHRILNVLRLNPFHDCLPAEMHTISKKMYSDTFRRT